MFVEFSLSKSTPDNQNAKRVVPGIDTEFDPIAAALRQMHDNVADEPVPDEFLKLLDQLEERLAEKDGKS